MGLEDIKRELSHSKEYQPDEMLSMSTSALGELLQRGLQNVAKHKIEPQTTKDMISLTYAIAEVVGLKKENVALRAQIDEQGTQDVPALPGAEFAAMKRFKDTQQGVQSEDTDYSSIINNVTANMNSNNVKSVVEDGAEEEGEEV